MNKNTKRRRKADRKAGNYFHGKPCHTAYADIRLNPENKRKRPYEAPGS